MSSMLDFLRTILARTWPFRASAGSRWVEPSSEITRMVMASIEQERDAARTQVRASPDMDDVDVVRADDDASPKVEGEPASERRHGSAA